MFLILCYAAVRTHWALYPLDFIYASFCRNDSFNHLLIYIHIYIRIYIHIYLRKILLWWHDETNSDLLFSKHALPFSFEIKSFSSKHKVHLFDRPVYKITCFTIDHVKSESWLLFFKYQMYFESSVSLEYYGGLAVP